MTLQGPHQVAKQSRTSRVSLVSSACSQSGFLGRCQYLSLQIPFASRMTSCLSWQNTTLPDGDRGSRSALTR